MLMIRLAVLSSLTILLSLSVSQAQPPANALNITNTLEGHKELVYSVAHSPDGKTLASGSFDKSVKLWDLSTGKETKNYGGPSGHTDLVLTTAFSPDGRLIASGAKDNNIRLWDAPISGALLDYAGSTAGLTTEAITADGSKLATGQADGMIRLWNTSDGKQLGELKAGGKSITALTISGNALLLAAGDVDGNVYLFQLSDNKPTGKMTAHTKGVSGLAFHANNQLLYSVGQDGLLKGWNVPFGSESSPYKLDKTTAVAAYRALDGRVALACADKTIRVLKADGTLEKSLSAASADIKVLSLHNNTVIASLADGKVAWWDVTAGTQVHQIDLGKAATSISLRGDTLEFAVALPDGTIKLGEVTKDKTKGVDKVITKTLPDAGKVVIQYHPTDINVLAIADDKKALKTWLVKEGKAEQTITLDAPAMQVTWSRDASRIAACVSNQLIIVQPKEGKLVTKINHASPVVTGGFGADTTRLITTTADGKSHIFDVGNGKELQSFVSKQAIVSGLSSDPKKLLLCSKEASFVEPITIAKFISGQHPIRGFALMDGGNRAVTVSDDGIGRIYNLGNGNLDKELKGHTGAIIAVVPSTNSQIVFTSGSDKTLRCFNANDGKEMKVLQLPAISQTLAVQTNTLVAGCADSSGNRGRSPG
jgi:WD40 repeat protein